MTNERWDNFKKNYGSKIRHYGLKSFDRMNKAAHPGLLFVFAGIMLIISIIGLILYFMSTGHIPMKQMHTASLIISITGGSVSALMFIISLIKWLLAKKKSNDDY